MSNNPVMNRNPYFNGNVTTPNTGYVQPQQGYGYAESAALQAQLIPSSRLSTRARYPAQQVSTRSVPPAGRFRRPARARCHDL